jgi:hypothetical protein
MARRVIGLLALLNDRSCYLLIGRRLIEADRGNLIRMVPKKFDG